MAVGDAGCRWLERPGRVHADSHAFSCRSISDQEADEIASYLTKLFGRDSVLPKSPADMPGYKDTVRPFSSDAMNIVYVEYDMPGPNRMPFSAAPDKDGYLWIPNFGVANKITRLTQDGRDAGLFRPQCGDCCYSFGRTRPRRRRVVGRASVEQTRTMGSQYAEDHRIPGCLSSREGRAGRWRQQTHGPIGSKRKRMGQWLPTDKI